MKISTLKKKYKNEWVLAEVLKEDKLNRVMKVRPLAHSKDREVVYQALTKVKKGKHVTTIYTGKVPPKGIAYTFYASIQILP